MATLEGGGHGVGLGLEFEVEFLLRLVGGEGVSIYLRYIVIPSINDYKMSPS